MLDRCLLEHLSASASDWILVSVNPDLCNAGGHYLYFDKRLKEAAEKVGGSFLSLASQSFSLKEDDSHDWVAPVFSQPTQPFSQNYYLHRRPDFADELRSALAEIMRAAPRSKVLAFLYSGHCHQLPSVIEAMSGFDPAQCTCVFNLYSAYLDFDEESEDHRRNALLEKTALLGCRGFMENCGVVVVADEQFSSDLVAKYLNVRHPILPFFSLVPPGTEQTPDVPEGSENKVSDKNVMVAYLSSAIPTRGFPLLVDAVEHCLKMAPEIPWHFVFRTGLEDKSLVRNNMMAHVESLEALGVEILRGHLDADTMDSLFRESDILVCPYRKRHFGYRTSANISDAISYGVPVVAAAETWAGRLIEELGIGCGFEDGSGGDLGSAIVAVAKNPGKFKTACRTAGAEWLKANNPEALIRFLLSLSWQGAQETDPVRVEWEEFLMRILQQHLRALLVCFSYGVEVEALDLLPANEELAALSTGFSSDKQQDLLYAIYKSSLTLQERNTKLTGKVTKLEVKLLKNELEKQRLQEKIEANSAKIKTLNSALQRSNSSVLKKLKNLVLPGHPPSD